MLVFSNYDTEKCRHQKIAVVKILILYILVPVQANTDTEKGSTKKRQY